MSQLRNDIFECENVVTMDELNSKRIVTREPRSFSPDGSENQSLSIDVEAGRRTGNNYLKDNPEANPDFRSIRIVSSIVLFFLRKCWMMCSTGLFVTFIAYWCYGSMIAFILFLFGISGLFYQISDWLLYHPDEPSYSRIYVPMPSVNGLPFEKLYLETQDGVKIQAVFIKQPDTIINQVPTILFFHGNAGNIGHRLPFVQGFYNVCRCNVLLVEYRGYGRSEGHPSENGLYLDAQAGLKFLLQQPHIDREKIVVFGRSLGGAVAIDLVSRPEYARHILVLIVENTFTSIPEVAQELFSISLLKWLPVWAYKNKFNSVSKIGLVKKPSLFISGQADALIPPEMMRRLIELCGSSMKRLQLFPNGTHNETWKCKGYYRSVNMFLDDVMLLQGDSQQWSFENFRSKGPIEIY